MQGESALGHPGLHENLLKEYSEREARSNQSGEYTPPWESDRRRGGSLTKDGSYNGGGKFW
jgi:hypothetical protein